MSGTFPLGKVCRIVGMEEPGEQCIVVFALIVTGNRLVSVCV
jgi:hypothetical protein